MQNIEALFEKNLEKSQTFSKSQMTALMTLNEALRGVHKTQDAHQIIVEVAKMAGYEIIPNDILPENQEESEIGFPLRTDQKLNGKDGWGSIIPINPAMEQLQNDQKKFLAVYAERAGLYIDHIHLYTGLNKKVAEVADLHGILAHELKSPLTLIKGWTCILLNKAHSMDEDKKREYIERVKYGCEQLEDLIELLNLDGTSKEDLLKNSEMFNINETATKTAKFYDEYMSERKIGLRLKYTPTVEGNIPLYANKAVLNAIWGTLFSNSLAWVPEGTRINQTIRVEKNSLRILMENQVSLTKRSGAPGMGKGRGVPFVDQIIQKYNGQRKEYRISKIDNSYDIFLHYGDDKAVYDRESTIFGTSVKIPMSEISESAFVPPKKN